MGAWGGRFSKRGGSKLGDEIKNLIEKILTADELVKRNGMHNSTLKKKIWTNRAAISNWKNILNPAKLDDARGRTIEGVLRGLYNDHKISACCRCPQRMIATTKIGNLKWKWDKNKKSFSPGMKYFVNKLRQKIAEIVMTWCNIGPVEDEDDDATRIGGGGARPGAGAAGARRRGAPASKDRLKRLCGNGTIGEKLFLQQAEILDKIRMGAKGQATKDTQLLSNVARILLGPAVGNAGTKGPARSHAGDDVITKAKLAERADGLRVVINNSAIFSGTEAQKGTPGDNSGLLDKRICTVSSIIDGGARTAMGRQCTYNKSQEEKNQEYGEERIKFHCKEDGNIASYEFNGTLSDQKVTAVPLGHRLIAPKKRISLQIIFPNSTQINTNLEITIHNSNDVQLKCVYFDSVIPELADFLLIRLPYSPARATRNS